MIQTGKADFYVLSAMFYSGNVSIPEGGAIDPVGI